MGYLFAALMKITHVWTAFKRWLTPDAAENAMSLILPGLFLSGFFTEWPALDVVNVAEENDYVAPLGRMLLNDGRPDLPPGPTPAELEWIAETIIGRIRLGRTILVVCDEGNHRSATVVCAVVMILMNLSADQAIAFVQQKRPSVGPHWWQREALKAFEVSLGKPNGKPADF